MEILYTAVGFEVEEWLGFVTWYVYSLHVVNAHDYDPWLKQREIFDVYIHDSRFATTRVTGGGGVTLTGMVSSSQ